jgi:hypothetical protein
VAFGRPYRQPTGVDIVSQKASGISIDLRQFDLYDFRDGQIVRATLGFESREQALEAAGRDGLESV